MLLTLAVCVSCSSSKNIKLKEGMFVYKYKNGEEQEELLLKADSSFILNSYKCTSCTGRWKMLSKDTIMIKCNSIIDVRDFFKRDYMHLRERKIKIINNEKLKMPIEGNSRLKYVILKKVGNT